MTDLATGSVDDDSRQGIHNMTAREILRSQRLILRRLAPDDRAEILAMHEAAQGNERWSPPIPHGSSFAELLDRWLNDDPTKHVRLVTERLDATDAPRLANILNLTDVIRGVFQNAFIGWRTHPGLLNRGYCSEAVRLTLSYAFATDGLHLHRVQASIAPENLASCRVAEKCGFRLEGVAQRYLFIREKWRDHLMFAITSEEHVASAPS